MEGSVRLDLGAGDKREAGWVSVDSAVERNAVNRGAGTIDITPDIVCDLRAIPLPDSYADEARAIHVIEHFYAWEAVALLTEWVRVIKPGGQLALECPDLDKVIALANVPGVPPQYTMWALYGDPRYADPAMCHKWCYTHRMLSRLMEQAGLTEIRAEPVRFHVPVRDMRLVGIKPSLIIKPE